MQQETANKIFRYCYAGCCGVLGFIGAYWLLGLILDPIDTWIIRHHK